MIEIELKRHVSAATDDENKKKWKVEKIDFNLAFKGGQRAKNKYFRTFSFLY